MKAIRYSIATLVMAFSPLAFADPCAVTLGITNISISWDLSFNYQAVTLVVTKTSNDACDYGIGFSKSAAGNYTRKMTGPNGVSLNYQLYKDANLSHVLKDAGDITSNNDVILGHFDAGAVQPQVLTYYAQIPLGLATSPAFKPYGAYSDTFNVSAYEGANPVQYATPIASMPVNISVSIPKIVQLSVGSVGDSFDSARVANTISFGNLATGSVAQRDVLVRTNAGYTVSISSANQGKLVHSNPLVATTVPYTFMLNGAALDFSTPQSPVTTFGQTNLAGDRYPVLIRIGNINHSMAGTYSDTISISVISTD